MRQDWGRERERERERESDAIFSCVQLNKVKSLNTMNMVHVNSINLSWSHMQQ